jgi:CubicO group peptidase (beta-lactamase class C family)
MRGYGYADAEARVPATAETVYRIGSINKQFVAAAFLQLADQGKVRLDDPITKFIPEFAGYADGVTLHHLLTHTSGLPAAPSPPWDPEMTRRVPPGEVLLRLRNTPIVSPPGERWAYNNSGYFVLGTALERITGKSYPQYFQEAFFGPLRMTSTVYCDEPPPVARRARGYVFREGEGFLPEPVMNMSVVGAGGSHCSTVGDLLRWQRALIGGRIVAPRSYAAMTTPVTLNDGTVAPYGYGLGIRPVDGERGISHGGAIVSFWSYLSYYPDRDLHIAVLINSGGLPSRPFAEELARRVFAALDASDR